MMREDDFLGDNSILFEPSSSSLEAPCPSNGRFMLNFLRKPNGRTP